MTKKEDTLAALTQLKRAISQSRDAAIIAISRMIAIVNEGGDFAPLPEVERATRKPMKPMVTAPETTDEPSDVPDEKTEDA